MTQILFTDVKPQLNLTFYDNYGLHYISFYITWLMYFYFSGIELRMYGSSLTGLGLKTSDLNLDLRVPDGINPAQLLTKVYRLLNNSGMISFYLLIVISAFHEERSRCDVHLWEQQTPKSLQSD